MKQNTPKPYLSHSQIELVFANPVRYISRYVYGEQEEASPQQAFGKVVTDILEGRVKGNKKLLKQLSKVKRYQHNDVAIRAIFKRGKEEVPVIGYLDGQSGQGESLIFGEYKTGVWKWDAKRVRESEQLKLYAAIHWLNTGYIPDQELIWIPTKNEKGVIALCGDPMLFKVRHNTQTVLETIQRVFKAYDTITRLYKEFKD